MSYVTGKTIKELREKQKLTQKELADKINVSDKTVSKWETDKGLPDIAIIEDLARALGTSIAELLTGDLRENENVSANMKKTHFYVCPVCGNVVTSVGQGSFSCCGITLLEQEPETCEEGHKLHLETVDNEYHVTMDHPMTKGHYISFIAYVTSDGAEIVKLYPEQDISVRFRKKGHGILYAYCNRHGMVKALI
ncbi:helix-turn-helix domain-containing protein [Faecalicatena contorta]|uniref:helix-turn-helix domain-containing protein n=1 Tax=Faecalicatena contorta TaxID=39482 RepID=UPI001F353367|nr:helix-turn-helix domain-containing protein [Faecalicatena contorta]MCF2555468.1 helix-turn-helix domain-containing protein [Faecalicatena contorta]MCF2680906.1 helix-turn-helix domain-containing protein [Faecalicatena contorta]